MGDMVIVHCDRGYNIGFVNRELDAHELMIITTTHFKPKKILSDLPHKDEKIYEMLSTKVSAENLALEECRAHCQGRKIGALTDILGAEFQFDRKKLTIFVKLYQPVSVCRLVRKLYDTFKMRVKVLEVESIDEMEERAKRYLQLSELDLNLVDLFDRSVLTPKPLPLEPLPVPVQALPMPPQQQAKQRKRNSPQPLPLRYPMPHEVYLQYSPYAPQLAPPAHLYYPRHEYHYDYSPGPRYAAPAPPAFPLPLPPQANRRSYQDYHYPPAAYPTLPHHSRATSPNAFPLHGVRPQRPQPSSSFSSSSYGDSFSRSYASSPDNYNYSNELAYHEYIAAPLPLPSAVAPPVMRLPPTSHIAAGLPPHDPEESRCSNSESGSRHSPCSYGSDTSAEEDQDDLIQSLIASLMA
jgi:hypothetical protein